MEHDVLHSLHLGGRACETTLTGVAIDVSHAPLVEGEVGTFVVEIVISRTLSGAFHGTGGALILHHEFSILGAAGSSATVDGEHHGQGSLHGLHATVDDALHGHLLHALNLLNSLNLFHVSHLVEAQLLSHLRTHLSRVTIDGLTTTNDDINVANLLDGRGEGVAGSERVGTCEQAVGQEPARVGTTVEALADDLTSTGRTHREHAHRATGVLLFQTQCLFERIQIFRIKNCGQCSAIHRSFGSHCVLAHITGVWHLLGQHNDFQCHILLRLAFCHFAFRRKLLKTGQRYDIISE